MPGGWNRDAAFSLDRSAKPPGPDWYTPATLAKRLKVSERTVRNWVSFGQGARQHHELVEEAERYHQTEWRR
jgi:hypothetical protein